jgi:hypothetical protein
MAETEPWFAQALQECLATCTRLRKLRILARPFVCRLCFSIVPVRWHVLALACMALCECIACMLPGAGPVRASVNCRSDGQPNKGCPCRLLGWCSDSISGVRVCVPIWCGLPIPCTLGC